MISVGAIMAFFHSFTALTFLTLFLFPRYILPFQFAEWVVARTEKEAMEKALNSLPAGTPSESVSLQQDEVEFSSNSRATAISQCVGCAGYVVFFRTVSNLSLQLAT